jgi:hypothetical protein
MHKYAGEDSWKKILAGKVKGKGLLGRPRRSLEDSIKWRILNKLGWIDLAKDKNRWRAVVNAVMNLRVS